MARHLGVKVLQLIRARSYATGELPVLEKKVVECEAALEDARAALAVARDQIAKLDAQIAELEPGLTR